MKRTITILIICILFLSGCRNNTKPPIIEEPTIPEIPENPEVPEAPIVDPIEEVINGMTIDEKIGQLLIVGIEGNTISDVDRINILENKVGGFILFSRNIENKNQVTNLLDSLKEINKDNKLPLFLSVDEEGGLVSRLSKIYTNLPDAATLGSMDNEELSFEYGENLGIKLRSLGFNLNFAPVLDINSNSRNPVIGKRAFGNTADIVTKHGLKVMEGIISQDIIPAAKHFPGHGDTITDSHLNLPRIDKSLKELENLELTPFKSAIDDGIDMIMVAHILFPQIDEELPATMSNVLIDEVLREDLGFEGVIISDDMTMGAIVNNYSIEDAAIKFLTSGGDIALVCHGNDNQKLVIDRIKTAIENGELSMEQLDAKVYRIIQLKYKYNLEEDNKIDIDTEELNNITLELNNKLK